MNDQNRHRQQVNWTPILLALFIFGAIAAMVINNDWQNSRSDTVIQSVINGDG